MIHPLTGMGKDVWVLCLSPSPNFGVTSTRREWIPQGPSLGFHLDKLFSNGKINRFLRWSHINKFSYGINFRDGR